MSSTPPQAGLRIVSLVPSLTELLCDLDLGDQIVGRTGFCIHPKEIVRQIPKVGGTKDVDVAAVKALKPTHLVVNIDENRKEVVDALQPYVGEVIVTHPLGPLDNLDLYQRFGKLFGREALAQALCDQFRAALPDSLALNQTHDGQTGDDESGDGPPSGDRQRVLYLIWRDPWMTISRDTYIARTLQAFGWQTWASAQPQRYPTLELEECRGAIDRVLLSSEPYPFRDKHIGEIHAALPGIPVQLIDGEMVSWYGSRAIAGLHYLKDFTHSPV